MLPRNQTPVRHRGTTPLPCGLSGKGFLVMPPAMPEKGDLTGGENAGVSLVIYSPEVIEIMSAALESSVNHLPEPVSATQVHHLAESILHSAGCGGRDAGALERIALVELRIAPRG